MSYCRWSSDDFQCDLYCYEHVDGGWTTHVAANRIVYDAPLPPPVESGDFTAWYARLQAVRAMRAVAGRSPIGLAHDGKTFNVETLDEFLALLLFLRGAGYRFPDEVLEDVRAELAHEASP